MRVKESTSGTTTVITRASGRETKCMAEVSTVLQMVQPLKASSRTTTWSSKSDAFPIVMSNSFR